MVAKLQVLNELKSVGKFLRGKLKEMSFGLEDSFCDANDLKASVRNTRMPESVMEFLGALLNISKADFVRFQKRVADEELPEYNDDDDDVEDDNTNRRIPKKILKANSLFQIMFYIVNNGNKKCPFHVMFAHAIYEICKSRGLITIGEHLGFCISYPTLLRMRALLGFHVMCLCRLGNVPLPSHFNTDDPVIASLDNFDHNDASSSTGKHDTHDSVMVLFQRIPFGMGHLSFTSKGKVSHYTDFVVQGRRYIISSLPCQQL